jgi:hypothetical protein
MCVASCLNNFWLYKKFKKVSFLNAFKHPLNGRELMKQRIPA